MSQSQYVIGVDVGGTNIKFGIIHPSGKVVSRSTLSTGEIKQTPKVLINAICTHIKALMDEASISQAKVAGVGIGLPGLIDVGAGVVRQLPNIHGWKDVPIKKMMERALKIPVQIENDVNMITLGEWEFGAGKGFKNVLCLTLGTGVGAGLILNGEIYRGASFSAGEIGHAPLERNGIACTCGGQGCFERYVGNQRLQQEVAKFFKNKNIALEDVAALAKSGNKKALRFWENVGGTVAEGLIGPINILNPKRVIIGGGVARSFRFMKKAIEKVVKERCMKVQARTVRIVKASLDNDAGLIGAKVLVSHEKQGRP